MTADLAQLAKGGRTNVAGFLIRLIARIPFLFIGAQWYGAEALGRLAYAIVVVEFAAQISTLGLKRGLALHLAGDGKENGAWDGLLLVVAATLPLTIGLMLLPEILFPNSVIRPLDYTLPLLIPPLAAIEVMLAALAYRYNVQAGVTARAIVEPWTISIAAILLWYSTPTDGMLVAYALSIGAALVASAIPFVREIGMPTGWKPRVAQLYALARRNAPLAAADAIDWGSRRLDIVILGLFVSPATVGLYWVAQQIASLPQKLKSSFDPVLGPALTERLSANDKPGIARLIGQVGFWILAAQAGVALALGIPGEALMALIGPARDFVKGNGALALLLLAEVVAVQAVVSEAALVYVARHRNMLISLGMIGVQALLSVALIMALRANGYPEAWQAAGAAGALAASLALGSLVKSRLAIRLLGADITVWRWSLLWAVAGAVLVGALSVRLADWVSLALGIPATLAAYGWFVWTRCFTDEDRLLFRRNKAKPAR